MDIVGEKFESGDPFLPEMLAPAMTMKTGVEVLKPHLTGEETETAGTVVIGTVQGDVHDIGGNLVAMMLEGAGFEVIDIGIDVPAEDIVKAVEGEKAADTWTFCFVTHYYACPFKTTIDALKEAGLRDKVKVMVGGAPVTQDYADEIGADGYASDAAGVVTLARGLVQS